MHSPWNADIPYVHLPINLQSFDNVYQRDRNHYTLFPMSDAELQAIRRAKLQALQKKLVKKKENPQQVNSDKVLNKIFRGRAWEVFNVASQQYPDVMLKLKPSLVKLALSGRIREVTGEQLYFFLRNLGLRIRLKTHIRFTEHGKLKSLSEKFKEDLSKI